MRGIVGAIIVALPKLKRRWNKLRYMALSSSFEQAGKRGSIGRDVRFLGDLKVTFGDRVTIRDGVRLGGQGDLIVGDRTSINEGCIIAATVKVELGSNVMLAPRVYILDVDHKYEDRSVPISAQGYEASPVKIGDGVWIGTGAVITKGVTIGEGSIVGANSVVTKDIPSFVIAAGAPAKVVRQRP